MNRTGLFAFIAMLALLFAVVSKEEVVSKTNYSEKACVGYITDTNSPYSISPGIGTGFFVNNSENPYFITNRHVVGDNIKGKYPVAEVYIHLNDKQSIGGIAKTVCIFNNIDIAVLQLPKGCPSFISFCKFSQESYKIGDDIHFFGVPGVPGHTFLHQAKVSCLNIKYRPDRYELDAANMQAIPGNSGSPIFNSKGKCIGVLCVGLIKGPQALFVRIEDIRNEFDKAGLKDILNGTFIGNLAQEYGGNVKYH